MKCIFAFSISRFSLSVITFKKIFIIHQLYLLLLHTDIISYHYKQFSNATLLSIGERGDCFYCPSSRNVAQTTIRRRPRNTPMSAVFYLKNDTLSAYQKEIEKK